MLRNSRFDSQRKIKWEDWKNFSNFEINIEKLGRDNVENMLDILGSEKWKWNDKFFDFLNFLLYRKKKIIRILENFAKNSKKI